MPHTYTIDWSAVIISIIGLLTTIITPLVGWWIKRSIDKAAVIQQTGQTIAIAARAVLTGKIDEAASIARESKIVTDQTHMAVNTNHQKLLEAFTAQAEELRQSNLQVKQLLAQMPAQVPRTAI